MRLLPLREVPTAVLHETFYTLYRLIGKALAMP
jgi:hypothetical protein